MEIIKAYAVKNLCYIAGEKMEPKGIVVHSTGANNPNLKRYVDCAEKLGKNIYGNHWNKAKPGGKKICVHAFIGYDKNKAVKVAEILPTDICCWGIGSGERGSYNYNPPHIQFEICEDGLKDEEYYKKVFDEAVKYCAYLCKKYGLSVKSIVSHKEAAQKGYGSNHGDPEHWMKRFGDNMNRFRERVAMILRDEADSEQEKVFKEKEFFDGDLVSIAEEAVYYSGKKIPAWVKAQRWYVKGDAKGDRVVINENEDGELAICSPINSKYLKLIKRAKKEAE